MDLNKALETHLVSYLQTIVPDADAKDLGLALSQRAEYGDFQLNGFFGLARSLQRDPQALAADFLKAVQRDPPDWWKAGWVSGKAFVSFRLCQQWLLGAIARLETSGFKPLLESKPQTVVIDYSSPNVAKPMAVHHMRSTFLGDAMARVLNYLGHVVIRVNHLGDFGTQFGLLIAWIEEQQIPIETLDLNALEKIYQAALVQDKKDEAFHQLARAKVVALHDRDPVVRAVWQQLVHLTLQENQRLYDALGILLTVADAVGESYYEPYLPQLLDDLMQRSFAHETAEGAIVAELDDTYNKLGERMGVVLRKSDGAYLYASTDLACVWYRANVLKADRILYCVDSRQKQHFEQVWALARKVGYLPDHVQVEHQAFGMMLGKDGKPFKTRSGGTLKLGEFLLEAKERVAQLIQTKSSHLPEAEQKRIIDRLAVGVMKYADLMRNRLTDYRFDWEEALSLEGNTAPYLFYARVRAKALLDRCDTSCVSTIGSHEAHQGVSEESLLDPHAQRLAIHLLHWQGLMNKVALHGQPHLLCTYLYELSGLFSTFYEHCDVVQLPKNSQLRETRVRLVKLTEAALRTGLDLLGISVVDRM